MLKEILNAFVGSATNTSFSLPSNNSGINVPIQATFKKFFSTFTSTLSNPAANSYTGGFPGVQGGIGQFPGTQGFPGQFPGAQGFPGQFPMLPNQIPGFNIQNLTNKNKNLKSQAFAPGSVLINASQLPIGAVNPFQGFAGQNGAALAPGFFPNGGINSIGTAGQFQNFPAYQQGFGSKLPLLIMPFIGLFGLLKSILNVRKLAGSLKPEIVNKENLNYNSYQSYLDKAYDEGSFDEPLPYEDQETVAQNNFNYSDNLAEF